MVSSRVVWCITSYPIQFSKTTWNLGASEYSVKMKAPGAEFGARVGVLPLSIAVLVETCRAGHTNKYPFTAVLCMPLILQAQNYFRLMLEKHTRQPQTTLNFPSSKHDALRGFSKSRSGVRQHTHDSE